jgi:hypothetical protein
MELQDYLTRRRAELLQKKEAAEQSSHHIAVGKIESRLEELELIQAWLTPETQTKIEDIDLNLVYFD